MGDSLTLVMLAKNEEKQIEKFLEALRNAPISWELILVVNGCSLKDRTAVLARMFENITVFEIKENIGKAKAEKEGIRAAHGDIILLLDTDLEGLTVEHIKKLLKKFKRKSEKNRVKTVKVILLSWRRPSVSFSQLFFTFLSGQHMWYKKDILEVLESVPEKRLKELNLGIELYITLYRLIRKIKSGLFGWRSSFTFWFGVSQVTKIEKNNNRKEGYSARWKMYKEIFKAFSFVRKYGPK